MASRLLSVVRELVLAALFGAGNAMDAFFVAVEIGNDDVEFPGWEVPVGRVSVYLLDTDLPENDQRFRDLTAHVYGGDQWNRISQEIVLGIGGVRFLRALGVRPSVYHMNEGHSAFLTLELLRDHAPAAGSRGMDGSAPPVFNLAYPYFVVCLLASSATHQRETTFYGGLALLLGWALWFWRNRRFSPLSWVALVLVVVS